jgi:hypothetical protein
VDEYGGVEKAQLRTEREEYELWKKEQLIADAENIIKEMA